MPASRPRPLATMTSASCISAAWAADSSNSWGSTPAGINTSTSAASPTMFSTTSPRMLVVTITVGVVEEDEVDPSDEHAVAARASTPRATKAMAMAMRRWARSMVSLLGSATRMRTTLTAKAP